LQGAGEEEVTESGPDPKSVEDWTAADVELWLKKNGFEEKAPLFFVQHSKSVVKFFHNLKEQP